MRGDLGGSLVLAVALAASVQLIARPARAEPAALRLVSFNVWGVPLISPSRAERIERIVPAIAELEPNVVALQEAWTEEDARHLRGALIEAGLKHVEHFASDALAAYGSAGLLVASDTPMSNVQFVPFDLGRRPHTPWHVDWIGTKGALRVTLETGVGPVEFVTAHLQASYLTGDYVPTRLGQALSLSDLIGTRAGPRPLILAGDLNSPPGGISTRALGARSGLVEVLPDSDLDTVLYREAVDVVVRAKSARRVLDAEFELADGTRSRLSDHPALVVDFELWRRKAGEPLAPTPAWNDMAVEVRRILGQERRVSRTQRWLALAAAFVLALAAGLLVRASRRSERRRRLWLIGAAAALGGVIYCGLFGLAYAPQHIDGIERAIARVGR